MKIGVEQILWTFSNKNIFIFRTLWKPGYAYKFEIDYICSKPYILEHRFLTLFFFVVAGNEIPRVVMIWPAWDLNVWYIKETEIMERLNSIFYLVILYYILILALEVDIMESSIIQKEKRSYKVRTVVSSFCVSLFIRT